jgi:hypothetical protein
VSILVQDTSKVSSCVEQMSESSEPVVVESITPYIDPSGSFVPPPPPTITINDILSAREVLIQRETEDKGKLEGIATLSIEDLRTKLIAWAVAGFPNNYPIRTMSITPPSPCSDGVVRNLADYIVFCSGKTLTEHIAPLQATLPDITVAFTYSADTIAIVVIKA